MKKLDILLLLCLFANTIGGQNLPNLSITAPVGSCNIAPDLPSSFDLPPNGSPNVKNYIRTWIPQIPITDESQIDENASPTLVTQSTTYVDGKGNPIQKNIRFGVSPSYHLIIPLDNRIDPNKSINYLPYSINDVTTDSRKFRYDCYNEQVNYFATLFPDEGNSAFSLTETVSNSNGVVAKVASPGKSQVGQSRGVSTRSVLAGPGIRQWELNSSNLPETNSLYNTDELYAKITLDINGTPSFTYTDKEGKLICTAVAKNSYPCPLNPGGSGGGSSSFIQAPALPNSPLCYDYAYTYYVYNELGQLVYTLPSKAVEAIESYNWLVPTSILTSILSELCFYNEYDELGRVISKHNPGQIGNENVVYDRWNKVVLSQTPQMQVDGKWDFNIYDHKNRPVLIGILNNNNSRAYWQYIIDHTGDAPPILPNNNLLNDPLYIYTYLINGINTVISNGTIPSSINNAVINTMRFYDSYVNSTIGYSFQFDNGPLSFLYPDSYSNLFGVGVVPTNSSKDLLVASRDRVIKNSSSTLYDWVISGFFYDNDGRLIQTQRYDNLNNLIDESTSQYAFNGSILRQVYSFANYQNGNNDLHTIYKKYTYQPKTFKLLSILQKIDQTQWVTLSSYGYDNKTGLTTSKSLGGIENQLYNYDIRGNLTGINKNYAESGANSINCTFGESIKYDYGFTNNRNDGSISGVLWKTSSSRPRAYGYEYDVQGKLTHAEFSDLLPNSSNTISSNWTKQTTDYTVSDIDYDVSGNLLTMKRRGMGLVNAQVVPVDIDNLTYTYNNSGLSNKLNKVEDNITCNSACLVHDFHNHNIGSTDYEYDNDGRLTLDNNKHITSITYNAINKPERINFASTNKKLYSYSATGQTLEEINLEPANNLGQTNIYHVGPAVYKNGVLDYILHEEGRARFDNSNPSNVKFNYDYFTRDHIGNVMTTVTAEEIPFRDYFAQHEVAYANIENLLFDNIEEVREPLIGSTDPNNQYAATLNGSDPTKRVGTSLLLRVMAGDKFSASAIGYYDNETTGDANVSSSDMANSIITALTGHQTGFNDNEGVSSGVTVSTLFGTPIFATAYSSLINQSVDPAKPHAFLNYLVFDSHMELVPEQSHIIQVNTPNVWHQLQTLSDVTVNQNGYLAVFISNETENKNVLFDNVDIKFYKGVLLEENHYYPYGMLIREGQIGGNISQNNYTHQSNELLTTKTGVDDDELGLSDFHARLYDPQLGIFRSQDPMNQYASGYIGMGDNPVSLIDPSGMQAGGSSYGGGSSSNLATSGFLNTPTTNYMIDGMPTDDASFAQSILLSGAGHVTLDGLKVRRILDTGGGLLGFASCGFGTSDDEKGNKQTIMGTRAALDRFGYNANYDDETGQYGYRTQDWIKLRLGLLEEGKTDYDRVDYLQTTYHQVVERVGKRGDMVQSGGDSWSTVSEIYFFTTFIPSLATSLANDTKYGRWASMGGLSYSSASLSTQKALIQEAGAMGGLASHSIQALGIVGAGLTLYTDLNGIRNGTVTPWQTTVDAGMSALGIYGGLPGVLISGTYFFASPIIWFKPGVIPGVINGSISVPKVDNTYLATPHFSN